MERAANTVAASYGIYCKGKLTVEGTEGGTLKVDGTGCATVEYGSVGVLATGQLEVSNAVLTGNGGSNKCMDGGSTGISCQDRITVASGGKVYGTGGDVDMDTCDSRGVNVTNGITIEAGGEMTGLRLI